ncbi:twin-arginine translocase TatA/TatE family subunit [Kocuria rhizophila]|uniref:twin-arginine translocase TatA/TatE family subunit n=1 Tax=Kocuria TaxID=57493 RepID=UPI0008A0FA4C|nr:MULTISPECIES: twin-arginine translocase TatA/TatE family subunit [Kocuria]WIW68924.1 twin-arginine translocase TatA/TatE family subunit [Kocuria sp. ChxB]MCR4525074.1 twin-arginine translocase TatA/TatE family subunit [Kocuria rhizophila]MCT1545694.1 twin-arginine translocase TatA/TatE family subunit [Kocuria rhizophila]MCT1957938.1 twin-arginine translocase TatA/TatE family subunit [Kocuria rhizophila]MCT2073925.1 twin-arginine translocase TatA/TatE family subunit [Kocuria rhizophila]
MFGITGGEAIIILIVALVIIGPERVPEYAQKFKELVKTIRGYATGATEDLKETLGPEFSDMDWRKLDPRQYDPRVIVREALMEDDQERAGGSTTSTAVTSVAAPTVRRLARGERAPFDTEAT